MKKLFKYKITIYIIVFWVFFSVVGFLEKDTLYKEYAADTKSTPYFVLVLQGIHDRIFPWSTEDVKFPGILAGRKELNATPVSGTWRSCMILSKAFPAVGSL